jgi:hypothetical protein
LIASHPEQDPHHARSHIHSGSRIAASGVHELVTRHRYRARMELDEIFEPDESDIPPRGDGDDAYEL